MYFGAVEAGGTKFRVAIYDDELTLLQQTRTDTLAPDQTIAAAIDFLDSNGPIAALGIASFGPLIVDRDSPQYGTIATTPKPLWSDVPLLDPFRTALGVPTEIQTDVEAASVGENLRGAGKGMNSVAYVTVGTGIGAAVTIDGVPFRGRDHSELGHIPVRRVPGDRFPGHCPFHGDCLEGMASGPAIEVRWGAPGLELDGRDEVWELEAAYLAQLVRVLAYSFVPDVVVFGGGVIPEADIPTLHEAGISTIFTPGTPLDKISSWVDDNIPTRELDRKGTN